ncbi:MAG: hypothetical protein ACYCO5_14205 [Acidobacteriaceae bacterium]
MKLNQDSSAKIDEEIDAALKLLSEVQPPAAMGSRVYRRLSIAAPASQRARSARVLLVPAAGIAMAALALVAIFTPMHRTQRDQPSEIETARLVAATPIAQATIMHPSATAETKRLREGKRSVQLSTERRSRQSRENRHTANLLSYPLTRQEKLLLVFARTAKPEDLQALNPEYQAKVEAQQDAEFAAYVKSGESSDAESATQSNPSTQE